MTLSLKTFVMLAFSSSVLLAQSSLPVDGIAALVKGSPILMSELEDAKLKMTQELKRANKWDEVGSEKDFQKKVLDQLINERLLQDELSRRGLAVEDTDIDNAIQSIMKDNQVTSMTQFEQLLQTEGFTMPDYRKNLKKQIAQSRIMGAIVKPQVRIQDEDVNRALKKKGTQVTTHNKYEIQMIFKAKPLATKEQMKKIMGEISKNGFEATAKKTTEGPAKEEGGNIGSFLVSELQPELQKVVPTLKVGETSPILENDKGFTLIQVKSIKTESVDDAGSSEAAAIKEKLMQEESARVFERVVRDLRSKARIQILL